MPRLYNLDHSPTTVDNGKLAVYPGTGHDFTDEQVKAGITGRWSEEDPRAGIEQERAFKERRKAEAQPTTANPAEKE
jgi:hypothetical protein